MTKKVIRNFGRENGNKTSFRNLGPRIFSPVFPNSEPGLRLCFRAIILSNISVLLQYLLQAIHKGNNDQRLMTRSAKTADCQFSKEVHPDTFPSFLFRRITRLDIS